MLLSRALMRGYGMSRYQWPVHYALLHNDSLVGLRRGAAHGPGAADRPPSWRPSGGISGWRAPARSTSGLPPRLREDWLDTVDLSARTGRAAARGLELDEADRSQRAGQAAKSVRPQALPTAPDAAAPRPKTGRGRATSGPWPTRSVEAHRAGEQTLVIVNRVERAQALYDALERQASAERPLLHPRASVRRERSAIEAPPPVAARRGRAHRRRHPGGGGGGGPGQPRPVSPSWPPGPSLVQRFGLAAVGPAGSTPPGSAGSTWTKQPSDLALLRSPEPLAAGPGTASQAAAFRQSGRTCRRSRTS
ncbi:MAG: hypothetical protein U5L11_11040 [Arhodomonas sp.]|nr:hypothetical protein [Arhodomonas sp.]